MFSYLWPIMLVIVCNVFYQVCAKSVPAAMDPFASLTVTYLVGAAGSGAAYFLLNKNASLLKEYAQLNWAPFALGIVVVGLEVGYIYAYQAGWPVSVAFIVQSAVVALGLVAVGYLLYREGITWNKLLGVGICLVGLWFINK